MILKFLFINSPVIGWTSTLWLFLRVMRNKSYTNFLMLRSKMKSEGFISKKEEIGFDKLDTLIDENEVFEEQKVIDGIMFLSKQKRTFWNISNVS